MLTLASNILDVDNHYSLFRLCVSTLASHKNPELILSSLNIVVATKVLTDR